MLHELKLLYGMSERVICPMENFE